MDLVFKALADASRRRLLDELHARSGQTLTELCQCLDMSRQAVTKHLYVLEKAGLVTCVRRGRTSLWTLKRQKLEAARAGLDAISRQWDEALARLRALVED